MKRIILGALLAACSTTVFCQEMQSFKCDDGYSVMYKVSNNDKLTAVVFKGDDVIAQVENGEMDRAIGIGGVDMVFNGYVPIDKSSFFEFVVQVESNVNANEHYTGDMLIKRELNLEYNDFQVEMKAGKKFKCDTKVTKGISI